MKLLHAADLHLGSPLRTAASRDAAVGDLLAEAMRGLMGRIVDLAIAERVDAVVLAGDVFDDGAPDVTLRTRLLADLRRLARAGIPVALIRGNHDAMLDLARYGPPGDGIALLDRERPSLRVGDAVIHGVGHGGGREPGSLLPHYPPAEAGRINVGLMHTSLDGAAGHDPYAPCATGDLLGHGYDYWALGHVHRRAERIADGTAIVMPGIPQGRHANEDAGGTVTVATLGGRPSLRAVPVARVAFERVALTLDALDEGAVAAAFADAAPAPDDRHRVLRFAVAGTGRPEADLLAIARTALEGRDDVSVERVERSAAARPPEGDAVARIVAEVVATPGFRDEAARILAALREALPREIADELGPDRLDALTEEGVAAAMQALAGRAP